MKKHLRRRTFFGVIASSIVAACSPGGSGNKDTSGSNDRSATKVLSPTLNQDVFRYGVASGDPDIDSIVIWTHITTDRPQVGVLWEMALTEDFSTIVASGRVETNAEQDFTVKAIPGNLESGQQYFYRFVFDGFASATGRTKTLPTGDLRHYGIALVSCSNYAFGYFNAYDAIAKDPDIDLVLHTGDYIYEHGSDGWGRDVAKKIGRVHEPENETVSLADYRIRHAQYKSDTGSQAMHAAHPLICCWDDHESTNNPWQEGAQNHQPETEGNWADRRDASIQAYYEWMPIRDPLTTLARREFMRHYRFGNLGSLVTLESRHMARAKQIDYGPFADQIQSNEDAERFKRDVIGAPNRKMISDSNQKLVTDTFKDSIETNQPWRLIGNASPIARMLVPDVDSLGVLTDENAEQLARPDSQSLIWKGKYNLPFYTDTWDGYPWARERLYKACREVGANDVVFLTGDSHSFWLNQLADAEGQPMGVEIGTAGVSSPGDFVASGWNKVTAEKLDRIFETELDEVLWTDNFHQGFVKFQLTPKKAKASFIAVSTLQSRDYHTSVIKQVFIEKKEDQLDFVS